MSNDVFRSLALAYNFGAAGAARGTYFGTPHAFGTPAPPQNMPPLHVPQLRTPPQQSLTAPPQVAPNCEHVLGVHAYGARMWT